MSEECVGEDKMRSAQTVYYGKIRCGQWQLYIAATEKGLCYVGGADGDFQEMLHWLRKNIPNACVREAKENLTDFHQQFAEYFSGQRKTFTFPLDVIGSSFQKTVWHELLNIPYGSTVSYSDIAAKIGHPHSVRAVGKAIGTNPLLIVIPCHRVIRKNGSLGGFRGGLLMKKQLQWLEARHLSRKTL